MIQKVLKVGSSLAVTIPKKSLKDLGIRAGGEVSVAIDVANKRISFEPVAVVENESRADHIAKLGLDFVERYRSDLERLAKE